ncbi:MAG: MotA/TolQ/ExbB proton channel family protein [Desulfobulbaceae bacterium]|jgi:chemotaxis protein MotA|nr:MotA/TolQ/ExbB proton channel family protein [Desulfobulbaceae bacterium]
MQKQNFLGVVLATAIFLTGFIINDNLGLYLNLSGFAVVVGGTAAATFLSFGWGQLLIAARVLLSSYRRRAMRETEIINLLIDLSIRSRMDGILALQRQEQETTVLFLRRALSCLVDGFKADQMRDILNAEMYFFRLRREELERIFRAVAGFAPAFGLIGSVIGLVAMVGGIGETEVILRSIPVALTSTLYGLVIANFFFLPFAARLRERTNQELLMQKIIMEGVIAIESEMNPVILKTRLESFLTPSARDEEMVSYQEIREKFFAGRRGAEPAQDASDLAGRQADAEADEANAANEEAAAITLRDL